MEFKLLDLSDYSQLKPYFALNSYPHCVYSLQSTLVWRNLGGFDVSFAIDEGALWFNAVHKKRPHLTHLVLPIGEREFAPRELHKKAIGSGVGRFWYVPENYVEKHREALEHYFELSEQVEYEDYVYRTSDLADLAGKKYSKKRNLISQFEKETLANCKVEATSIVPSDFEACREMLEKWCASRGCSDGGSLDDAYDDNDKIKALLCEKEALLVSLKNIEFLEWQGLKLTVDGVVVALALAGPLTSDMGLLSFQKALIEYKGLGQYFDRECARQLFKDKFALINKESDMGEEGLRQAKASYFPLKTIKAYQLKCRVLI